MKDAGFTPRATDPTQDSWNSTVSKRAAERIGSKVDETKVPMFTQTSGPQGEQVEVWYAATKEGARASSIKYTVHGADEAHGARDLRRRRVREIRPSDRAGGGAEPLLHQGEGSCLAYQNKALAHLLAESGYEVYSVKLNEGVGYAEDLEARMAAAVESAAPRNARASF